MLRDVHDSAGVGSYCERICQRERHSQHCNGDIEGSRQHEVIIASYYTKVANGSMSEVDYDTRKRLLQNFLLGKL